MKICIPTQTQAGRQAQVYEHFGSAPFFTVIDTQNDSVEVIPNSDQHHAHGMCQPLSALAGHAVDAVVTGGMGVRAIQRLNAGGVRVFRAVPGTVESLLAQWLAGTLQELTADQACQHHGGCH